MADPSNRLWIGVAIVTLIVGLAAGYLIGYKAAPGNCYLQPEEYASLEDVPDGITVFPLCDDIRSDLARPRR